MATSTFHSVLTPLFYCTKIFGLTPFKLQEDDYKNNYVNMAYSIVLLVLFTFCSYNSMDSGSIEGNKITSQVMKIISLHLNIIAMIMSILLECVFKNKIIKNCSDLAAADRNFIKYLNIQTIQTYKKSRLYITIAACFTTIYVICVSLFNFLSNVNTDLDLTVFQKFSQVIKFTSHLITTFVALQFCAQILLIKERFKMLNDKVKEILTFYEETNRNVDSASVCKTLEKVKYSHNRLCKIAVNVNDAYAFQLLLSITQTFIVTVLIMFNFLKYMVVTSENGSNMTIFVFFYYISYFFLNVGQLFTLVFSCSNTVTEAQSTKILIYQATTEIEQTIKNYPDQLDLSIKTIKFSLQYIDKNLEFTACNLFAIDKDLLFSIAGAITTYCVIVLQFEIT
nr:gustatory receptor 14 [Podabrus annulatus]